MNEEAIKEFISINFIRLIAEGEGFIVTRPGFDLGEDLMVKQVRKIDAVGKFTYYTSGRMIELQLKCTSDSRMKKRGDFLKFRLKTRNFNNLIFRQEERKTEKIAPLLLIVLTLPVDRKKWLEMDLENGGMRIAGKAFWYLPPIGSEMIFGKSHVNISIPIENQVALDFFSNQFNQYYQS